MRERKSDFRGVDKILDIIRALIIDFRRGGGDIINFSEGKGGEKSRGEGRGGVGAFVVPFGIKNSC